MNRPGFLNPTGSINPRASIDSLAGTPNHGRNMVRTWNLKGRSLKRLFVATEP
ncbi:hypothetical protein PIB30_090434, partial [Stylosanthes scabra]|nr:hypothetical protein [Stylosanthes scabra]